MGRNEKRPRTNAGQKRKGVLQTSTTNSKKKKPVEYEVTVRVTNHIHEHMLHEAWRGRKDKLIQTTITTITTTEWYK